MSSVYLPLLHFIVKATHTSHLPPSLPSPSVVGVTCSFFTSPSSLPFPRITTSLLSACPHSSPFPNSHFLVLTQHICCSSPGLCRTLILFLALSCPCLPSLVFVCLSVCLLVIDMRLWGSSLITDNMVKCLSSVLTCLHHISTRLSRPPVGFCPSGYKQGTIFTYPPLLLLYSQH